MKTIFSFLLILSACSCFGQDFKLADTVKTYGEYENIYNRKISSDSASSSFVIFIKKGVQSHKHVTHTEHVYILGGTGEMTVGDRIFMVQKGDAVEIPKNTFHSLRVTSSAPVKVLSVQEPMFDGKDRIMAE